MTDKFKGTVCGIVAAICYGTNPLGALYLYRDHINTDSVLFYRYSLAAAILAIMLIAQKKSFKTTFKELIVISALGVLFAVSSLTLFSSFHYMDAGVASTLLFVYPVMVAVIMAIFYKERITVITILSLALAFWGINMLYEGNNGVSLSTIGIILVMISSLTYAVYIVVVNKSRLAMSSLKLTFYVLLFSMLTIIIHSLSSPDYHLQWLTTPAQWSYAMILAIFPTVISLVLMTIAVHKIGSTPTAIMGALEPLTAVVIGITVFGELFTMRLAIGILLILTAVILIIAGRSFSPHLYTSKLWRIGRVVYKRWRWK